LEEKIGDYGWLVEVGGGEPGMESARGGEGRSGERIWWKAQEEGGIVSEVKRGRKEEDRVV